MNNSLASKTTLIIGTLIAMPNLYGAETVYEVQKGDTLSKIAKDFSTQYSELGWRSSLDLIKEINADKFENYDQIHVGQKVRLPDQDYVHTYLAGMASTGHGVVKRKPFNPQRNLVKNLTSGQRELAQDTVKIDPIQKGKPENYTIEDAKKLEIKNSRGLTVNPRSLKEVKETVEVEETPVVTTTTTTPVVKAPVVPEPTTPVVKTEKSPSQSIKTYMIKKGDTLSEIALRFFGNEKLYDYNSGPMKKILELNPNVTNPDMILAGAELVLPGRNVANQKTTVETIQEVEKLPLEKQPEDELYWSQKERQDSLNPDFSFLDFQDVLDIEFVNESEGLTFKII